MILVFANDAGGAEVVAAYVKKKLKPDEFRAFVGGPAIKVFRRMKIPAQSIPDNRKAIADIIAKHKHEAVLTLSAAPGWMSHREWHGLLESKKSGIKTALYFDSWQNYRECLGYPKAGWKKNIPDEIWVGDKYAHEMAGKYFSKVRYVPNQYYKNVTERYRSVKKTKVASGTALFVSSPLAGVEETLRLFLSVAISHKVIDRLIIRFHPSDDRKKFDAIIRPYRSHIRIEKSTHKDVVDDLSRSKIIFGVETVAMVLAVLCGIRTLCFVAKGHKPTIPFKKIVHIPLNDLAAKRFHAELKKISS